METHMRSGQLRLRLSAAVLSMLTVAACANSGASGGNSSSSLPVGGLTLLTGEFASFGKGALQGMQAGVKQVNGAGGVMGHPLNLIVADSTSDPVDAVPAAVKLVNVNKVLFEVGVAGPLADATVSIFTKAKKPFLTPGGDVNFDKNTNPYVWRLTPSDSQLGVAMALYATKRGYHKAALMFTNNSTSAGLADVVRKTVSDLGGSIVSSVTLQPDLSSYQSEVSKTLAANPDVILIEMDAATAGVVFREMKGQNGLSVPLVGTDEDIGADFLKAVTPADANKALVSLQGGTFDSPAAGIFANSVKAVSKGEPLANAEYTYDGIIIASLAMAAAKGTTSTALNKGIPMVTADGGTKVYSYKQGVDALKAGKRITYIGASGPFNYNKFHNVFGPFIAVKASTTGSYSTVATLAPADLEAATK
jgi:ABC-type branched-subunit amino acid transport system substrate-binding protein